MNARMHLAILLLVAAPAAAQDPMPSLPTVKVTLACGRSPVAD